MVDFDVKKGMKVLRSMSSCSREMSGLVKIVSRCSILHLAGVRDDTIYRIRRKDKALRSVSKISTESPLDAVRARARLGTAFRQKPG